MNQTQLEKILARRVLARRRLLQFTKMTHPSYDAGWVHEDICRRLEKFSADVAAQKSPRLMLLMPPRHGKLTAHSTLVPTPQGMRTHGELRAGDTVFHPSGRPVTVLAVSAEDVADWEVRTSAGAVVKCHAEHEWTVFDRANGKWRTVTTAYLAAQTVVSDGRNRFQLPTTEALQCPEAKLPIDPYFLGAWLGDGASAKPVLCGSVADMAHIVARMPYELGHSCIHAATGVAYQYFKGGVCTLLRVYGLLKNKHIPEKYMFASESQRRALLAGLVDTDGSVEPGSQRVRFRTGSQALAEQVAFLARTLGYRASIDWTPADTRPRAIVGGESWCVQWTPHDGQGGGTLPRKVVSRARTRRAIGIVSVTQSESPEKGCCIQVDAPDGMYLVGKHLVPTHNSELASIRFPAWHLGHHPDHELINVGYNLDLPMVFSRKVRELVRDPVYQAIFPQSHLDPQSQSVEKWTTKEGGGFTAAGVGGGITGKGAHILIIDDPIKNDAEADSVLTRDNLWNWYQSTAYTRLAPGGGILVIETWWNDDDLAGRLQAAMAANPEADQFEIVKYPALSEAWEYRDEQTGEILRFPEEDPAPDLTRTLLRPKDFCLHEGRYPTEALKKIRANLQPRIWSALYQQNPVPDEGMYFRREYFKYETQLPATQGLNIFTAWDFAIGEKQVNDWTVGATLLQDENDVLHVLEVFRMKGDSFQIVEAILDTALRWGSTPSTGYLIGAEDGQIWRAIEPLLKKRMIERKQFPPYQVLRPLTDKMARARPLQGRMQQGRVVFHKDAGWLAQTEQELLRFPAGVHDDVVDALAWAVHLCMGKEPPKLYTAPPLPSWKDKLALYGSSSISHMAA